MEILALTLLFPDDHHHHRESHRKELQTKQMSPTRESICQNGLGYKLDRCQDWLSIQSVPHGLLQMRRRKWLREEHPILARLKICHD